MSKNESTINNLQEKTKEHSSLMHTLRHDLRNYIAAIEGYTYLLKEDTGESEYLNRIISNIKNINELIDRTVFLADSELELEKSSEIDLNLLINLCKEIVPENVVFKIDKLPIVIGDYTRIQYVFKALIQNAVQHGKPNTIEIFGVPIPAKGYCIRVQNDGKKISPDKASNLFTKLPQTLKANSGLGLVIVKKIIDAHNWDIYYNEEIKDQTSFEIIIPTSSLIK